jgi:hypothetical protein
MTDIRFVITDDKLVMLHYNRPWLVWPAAAARAACADVDANGDWDDAPLSVCADILTDWATDDVEFVAAVLDRVGTREGNV